MNLLKIKTPSNLLNWWNFGSLIATSLVIQMFTGIMLSMNYFIQENMFFSSMNIYFNINYGWMLRIFHSNMTSMIFILLLIHIKRALYFNALFNNMMWISGMTMMLIIMAESFIGYSLVWNQMSYWAMMVITNFLSSIPMFGNSMVLWIWGNFKIDKILINRFFSIHFIIPFIIMMLIIAHLLILHSKKSSNPMGLNNKMDLMNLNPMQLNKDLVFLIIIIFLFVNLNMFYPFYFNNNDNFILMNYFKTPAHIEPEWYFLFFFSILRSINNKLSGLIVLMLSIFMLFILPKLVKNKFQSFNWLSTFMYSFIITVMLTISIFSTKNPEYPYSQMNLTLILTYFFSFLMIYIHNKIFSLNY